MNRKRLAIVTAAGAALALLGFFYWRGGGDRLEDRFLTEEVKRGSLYRTVSATGTLQAVVTVQVGSQVSGRIRELRADFNSVVRKGQVLAVIDPAHFEAQLERARANLATARAAAGMAAANLVNRKAELSSTEAGLEVARVELQEAGRQLERAQDLFAERLIPERELEAARAAYEQSRARVEQARAQIGQARASIRSAEAQTEQATASVRQAQAELRMADVNLHYTRIVSPIEGVVVERNVDIGQTVAASFQAPVLFLIANDLSKMQVIAQIDEADIGVISEEARVEFTVDAFAGETFGGTISEIRLSSKLPSSAGGSGATGTANVVVYNVIIDVENLELKLRPNMTATVNFTVAGVEDVLKIPNAALRYRAQSREKVTPVDSQAAARSGPADGAGGGNPSGTPPAHTLEPERGAPLPTRPATIEQYGIQAGPKIHFPEKPAAGFRWGRVWVLDPAGGPQPRGVKLGITDGRETAVMEGELQEGERVITWELSEEENSAPRSPFFGLFGGRRSSAASRRSSR